MYAIVGVFPSRYICIIIGALIRVGMRMYKIIWALIWADYLYNHRAVNQADTIGVYNHKNFDPSR